VPQDGATEVRIDICNCASLRRASRKITQFYDSRLACLGLRATQFLILAFISGKSATTVNDVAENLDLERSTAGQNLKVLERAGLIDTSSNENDLRSHRIALTALGREKLSAAHPVWAEAQQDFEALNGSDQATKIRNLLSEMRIPGCSSVSPVVCTSSFGSNGDGQERPRSMGCLGPLSVSEGTCARSRSEGCKR